MTKNIGFFGTKPWEKDYIEAQKGTLSDAALWFTEEVVSDDHPPKENNFQAISVFVDSNLTKNVLDKFPALEFIATRSTGFDHIDMEAAKARGIKVCSVPTYGANTVAEMTFGLILTLSRKIIESYLKVKNRGDWNVDDLRGFDLLGKTMGVVGTGSIGAHTIGIAKGFGMKISGYDPYPNLKLSAEYGFEYKPLEEVLAESDIVSLHVPYMPETHHLMNESRFAMMKRGALIINTSRGGIVDTMALVNALRSGQLGGAGLDVLEEEGVIKDEIDFLVAGKTEGHDWKSVVADHVLLDMPNVVITPHNAFNTKEAIERILDTTVQNIAGYLNGEISNEVKK